MEIRILEVNLNANSLEKIKIYEKEYIEVYLNLVEARGKLKKIVKVKQKKKKIIQTLLIFLNSMGDF